jgi:hypothetical protein
MGRAASIVNVENFALAGTRLDHGITGRWTKFNLVCMTVANKTDVLSECAQLLIRLNRREYTDTGHNY